MRKYLILACVMLFSTFSMAQGLNAKIYSANFFLMPEVGLTSEDLLQVPTKRYIGTELNNLQNALQHTKGVVLKPFADYLDERILIDVYKKNKKIFRICTNASGDYSYKGVTYERNLAIDSIIEKIIEEKFRK